MVPDQEANGDNLGKYFLIFYIIMIHHNLFITRFVIT